MWLLVGVRVLRRGLGSDERLLRGHDREVGHSAGGRRCAERQWVYATQGELWAGVMRQCMACTWIKRPVLEWLRERNASGEGTTRREVGLR